MVVVLVFFRFLFFVICFESRDFKRGNGIFREGLVFFTVIWDLVVDRNKVGRCRGNLVGCVIKV